MGVMVLASPMGRGVEVERMELRRHVRGERAVSGENSRAARDCG